MGSLAANCIDNLVMFVNYGEASKALGIDIPKVESLFSIATPKSYHGNSNRKSNLCVPTGSKFDKVQRLNNRRYSDEINELLACLDSFPTTLPFDPYQLFSHPAHVHAILACMTTFLLF